MASLTYRDEEALLGSVKKAADYMEADSTLSPTAAIEKVAREDKLGPGHTKAVCHAYNNGRQISQWGSEETLLDKMASFPLADFEAIERSMWPGGEAGEKQASADDATIINGIHSDYNFGPEWVTRRNLAVKRAEVAALREKEAAEAEPEPKLRPSAYAVHEKRASVLASLPAARGRFSEAREKAAQATDQLIDHFRRKQSSHGLPEVAYAASVYYGQPGRKLMGHVAGRLGEKLAAELPAFVSAMPVNQAPMTLVEGALGGIFEASQRQRDYDRAVKQAAVCDELLRRRIDEDRTGQEWNLPAAVFAEGHEHSLIDNGLAKSAADRDAAVAKFDEVFVGIEKASADDLDYVLQFGAPEVVEKQAAYEPDPHDTNLIKAAFMGFAGAAAIGSATKGMIDKALSPEAAKEKVDAAYGQISTPEHEDELRSIRAQAALASMMSDPKSPISGYEAGDVMDSYNEIAETAPTVADTPMALRSVLAKSLSHGSEPYDVAQLAESDNKLRQARNPSIMRSEG